MLNPLPAETTARRVAERVDAPELGYPWAASAYAGGQHFGGSAGVVRLTARSNAPARLAGELAEGRVPSGARLLIGVATDAVPPEDARYGLAEDLIRAALQHPGGVWVWSRRAAVADLLLARGFDPARVRVAIGLSTLQRGLAERFESVADEPLERLRTIARLAARGWGVDLMVGPIFPGVNDSPEALAGLIEAAAAAGARGLVPPLRRLAAGSRDWMQPNLRALHPVAAGRGARRSHDAWAGRDYTAAVSDFIEERAAAAGLVVPQPALRPVAPRGQMSLAL